MPLAYGRPPGIGMTLAEIHSTVALDGTVLSYRSYGDPAGRTVVLLHSLGTDGRMWSDCVERWASRYRLIVPDSRGHGASGPSTSYSVTTWAQDLDRIIGATGSRQVSLVGVSMGGIQAIAYASMFPGTVAALVVADSFLAVSTEVRDAKVATLVGDLRSSTLRTIARDYLAATFTTPYPVGAADVESAISEIDADSYVAATSCCFGADIVDMARNVLAPTLVLWGERDSKAPRDLSERIRASIRGASLEIVPDAGHLSNIDNPAEFSRLASEFIDSTS